MREGLGLPDKLELLLLCDRRNDAAAAAREHIDKLAEGSRHHVRSLSVFGALPARLDLDRFDGIIIHYSLMTDPGRLMPKPMRAQLARYGGAKAVFVQDEHRNVKSRIALLREMGTNILFTCVPISEIDKVYPQSDLPAVRKVNVLTGYASSELASLRVPSYRDRPIDVGYRTRQLPAWLGRLAWEKAEIGKRFCQSAARYGLTVDISVSEHDRLNGWAWVSFLTRCKATLGTESGASVFDMDGSIEAKVDTYVAQNPNATFDDLSNAFFSDRDGLIANAQVSPRVFEAASSRTLMILYPGHYSGVLRAWDHYVPLARDHSNMEEVVAVLRNPVRAEQIIDRAYREVAQNPNYGFQAMNTLVDDAIDAATAERRRTTPYTDGEWGLASRLDWISRGRRAARAMRDGTVRAVFKALARVTSPTFTERCKVQLRSRFG